MALSDAIDLEAARLEEKLFDDVLEESSTEEEVLED